LKISVVVVVYNMRRAAPRTLHSLSARYQRGIGEDDYEVIVVENGSSQPLDPEAVRTLGPQFRYFSLEDASPSPAPAVNFGLRQATGELVGVLVDGARIVTPNLLRLARQAAATHPGAAIVTPGWTLGRDPQNLAGEQGFDEAAEDALLDGIRWPEEPYRLFEIASLDGSSALLGPLAESNTLFMRRTLWDALGGMDERFDQPGGGLVNLDTLERALSLPESEWVLLLGEASFHQTHGGISTNSLPHQHAHAPEQWHLHYQHLRLQDWRVPTKRIHYYGTMPEPWRTQLVEWGNRKTLDRVAHLRKELARLHARADAAEARAEARTQEAQARTQEAEARTQEAEAHAREAEARAELRAREAEHFAEAARAEVEELRSALLASQAELREVRASLAFRGAHTLASGLRAAAPRGTRRRQALQHGGAVARWAVRWRLALASRPAREELRATLRPLIRRATPEAEIRFVASQAARPAFRLERWHETPLLHESSAEELLEALWDDVAEERERGAAPGGAPRAPAPHAWEGPAS